VGAGGDPGGGESGRLYPCVLGGGRVVCIWGEETGGWWCAWCALCVKEVGVRGGVFR